MQIRHLYFILHGLLICKDLLFFIDFACDNCEIDPSNGDVEWFINTVLTA